MISDTAAAVKVPRAFAVGWQVAELYHDTEAARSARAASTVESDALPGYSKLDESAVLSMRVDQLSAGLQGLIDTVPLRALVASIKVGADATQRKDEIRQLHVQAFTALTVADFRLGKAYGLGRAMAETVLIPVAAGAGGKTAAYDDKLGHPHRLHNIYEWLADLKTALPDHAAFAVSDSVSKWQRWLADPKIRDNRKVKQVDLVEVDPLLQRQGKIWRSLLSGERSAQDFLTTLSYVRAAQGLASGAGRVVGAFAARYKGLVLAFVVGLGGLIALFAFLAASHGASKTVWAGLTAVIGVVGGWKAVSSTLGRGLRSAEQPLFQAELDAAIAESVLILPPGYVMPPLATDHKKPPRQRGDSGLLAGDSPAAIVHLPQSPDKSI